MSGLPVPLDHIEHLCDSHGIHEHADRTTPRPEHGYCTDDNARLLVLMARLPATATTNRLSLLALQFVLAAQDTAGRTRNRMNREGWWIDQPTTEDCWGRSAWALGEAAVHHPDAFVRLRAERAFELALRQRSRFMRATAFAALGAADVLAHDPGNPAARLFLADALTQVGPPLRATWPWPEERLTYANASVAEAVIAAGAALGRPAELERGLHMLRWLLDQQMVAGHLSVIGTAGRTAGDAVPQFDQQPIEVAALADACGRALAVTGDRSWTVGIAAAAAWFDGANDAGLVMHDSASGGGYDGLHRDAVNGNQGAESTLAYLTTSLRAQQLAAAR